MGYFKRFTEWQNYVHYVLLTGGLFLLHTFSSSLELMASNQWYGWIALFFYYTVGFLIVDSLIHGIFWILPKKYGQWRD